MMYIEFQELFNEAQKRRPADKRLECPDPATYAALIEPFYMVADLNKPDFVAFYLANSETVRTVSQRLDALDAALSVAETAGAKAKEAAELQAARDADTIRQMSDRQKELEARVAALAKEKDDLAAEVLRRMAEAESLRKRYAALVRSLCDKCFAHVLFGETAE